MSKKSAKTQSRLFSSQNGLICGFDDRLRSFADFFMSEPIDRATETNCFEPEMIFSWLKRPVLSLCRLFLHKEERLCVEDNFFVALSIVFAAKTIFLRIGTVSPVPRWFFWEQPARIITNSILLILEIHQQIDLIVEHSSTVNALYRIRQVLFYHSLCSGSVHSQIWRHLAIHGDIYKHTLMERAFSPYQLN
jgi:hypothetical protein